MIPWYEDFKNFFFDEQYIAKCASANSSTLLEKCAGKGYYQFVRDFFQDHFFLYDNGFEGIRTGCQTKKGTCCNFHSSIENYEVLSNGWSGMPVARIQPPVPDYSQEMEFHYASPDDISSGEITEKFGLKKQDVANACMRDRDDYCPRKQLEVLVSSCGEPELQLKDEMESSVRAVINRNDTLTKMLA